MMNAEEFSRIMRPPKAQSVFRLGTVSALSGGKPVLTFDGEQTPSTKTYSYLASYTPAVGDRVLTAKCAGTYVVLGKINF